MITEQLKLRHQQEGQHTTRVCWNNSHLLRQPLSADWEGKKVGGGGGGGITEQLKLRHQH